MNPYFERFLQESVANKRPFGVVPRLKVLERESNIRGGGVSPSTSMASTSKPAICPNELAKVFKNLFNLK
jgi:hypothetical protein